MKTYSQDLRERMLAAVDRGMPRKEAAVVLGEGGRSSEKSRPKKIV
jgi:hypothetical protein